MSITTERCEFVGANVTRATKEALLREAQKRDISVSKLISRILEAKLKQRVP